MKKIIGSALNHPVSTVMFFISLLLLGGLSIRRMPIRLLPDISYPKILILTQYRGLPPDAIREDITIPLEDGFSSLKGLKNIQSISRNGLSAITLEFHWGTQQQEALTYTKEAVDRIYPQLPNQAEKPMVYPYSPEDTPLCVIGVFPKDNCDLVLARNLAERDIKTRLQQIPGVGSVSLRGGITQEVTVDLDQGQASVLGLTPQSVAQHIENYNQEIPAGTLLMGNMEYSIKTQSRFENLLELKELAIPLANQQTVELDIFSDIQLSHADQNSLFMFNDREGIALIIRSASNSNPLKTAMHIREELTWLQSYFHRDVQLQLLQDNSSLIGNTLLDLVVSGLMGALAAFFILWIFLRNLKSSLLLTLTIPISLIGSILFLAILGKSINLMSMGGLIIGIGMVVDNSVVILENLIKKTRPDNLKEIKNQVSLLSRSTLGSTLTTLVVFLPIIFIPGLLGSLFQDMALAVCFSLIISYIVSISLIPVLYHKMNIQNDYQTKERIETLYKKILKKTLRKPWPVLLTVAIIIILGSVSFFFLPKTFMEEQNQNAVFGRIILSPGSNMEYVKDTAQSIIGLTSNSPWIEKVILQAGGEMDDPFYLADPNGGKETIEATFIFNSRYRLTLAEQIHHIEELLKNTGFQKVQLSTPPNILNTLLNSSGSPRFRIPGEEYQQIKQTVESFISNFNLSKERYDLIPRGEREYIELEPQRETMAQYNLTPYQLSITTGSSLYGMPAGDFLYQGNEIPIRVRLNENDRENIEDINNLRILLNTQNIQTIPLDYITNLSLQKSPPFLLRNNRQDEMVLQLEDPTEEEQLFLSEIGIPEQKIVFEENKLDLLIALGLAVFLIFVLLASQFESYKLPLKLMSVLPISFFTLSIGLFITGKSFSLNSLLGILVLFGLSINNAIILFETYEQRNKECPHHFINVFHGSLERIKPILITTFTTIIAMIPVAVDPLGMKAQSGLAIAIIAGLIGSTLLTFFIIPPLFIRHYHKD